MAQLKILVVEDEFLIAIDLEQILMDAGHDVCGIASRHFTRAGMPLFVFITSHEFRAAGRVAVGRGHDRKPYNPCDVVSTAAYFAQGILTPPPTLTPPPALRLSPALHRRFETSPWGSAHANAPTNKARSIAPGLVRKIH